MRRVTRPKRWKVVLSLVVVAAVCAGCGSSSKSTHRAKASNAGSTASKRVVHVFGFGIETIPAVGAAFPTQTWETADPLAAAKAINADPASKVTIQYTFCDTKFTPTGSEQCARQVVSPTGCDGSPCDVAFAGSDQTDNLSVPVMSGAGMPIVGAIVNTPAALSSPNDFFITGERLAVQQGLGYVFKQEGAHKVGLIMFTAPQAQQQLSWTEQGIRANGLSVSGQQIIPVTAVNLSPTINTVLGGGGDGVLFKVTAVGAAVKYVKQAYSTKQSMLSALRSANDVNMYGVMPPWSASARGTNGAPACSPYHAFVPETLCSD